MDKLGLIIIFELVGVFGFGVLLIVGVIMLRAERAAKRAKKEGQSQSPEPKPLESRETKEPGAIASWIRAATKRADPPGAHEVLRVLRDHLTGRLIVEISGQRYAQAGDIQDPNIQQGLLTTLGDLSRFAGGVTPVPSAPVAPITAPTPPVTTPQVAPLAGATRLPADPNPAPPRPTPLPPISPPAAAPYSRSSELPPLEKPSMNPLKQMQILRERAKQPPPPPPKSIAEQIDEILQEKVIGTAQAQRGLHVRAGAQGHAVFELDGKGYEAVDDLPDADARALIRAAIAEWERKQ